MARFASRSDALSRRDYAKIEKFAGSVKHSKLLNVAHGKKRWAVVRNDDREER